MSQTLAPQMVRSSLDTLHERVKHHGFAADEVREVFSSCKMASLLLEKLWELAQELLQRGMERERLTFFLKESKEAIEIGLESFDLVRGMAENAELGAEDKTEALLMLERASASAREMREKLSLLLRWLETPAPKVDLSSLPKERGSPDSREYVPMDDLLARLGSGGDV